MEKKVTGIDLDELKKAREEMYREMGISSPDEQNNSNENEKESEDDISSVQDNQNDQETMVSSIESDEELLSMIEDFITEIEEDDEDSQSEKSAQNYFEFSVNSNQEVSNNSNLQTNNSDYSQNRNLSHYDVFAQFEINEGKSSASNSEINSGFASVKNDDENQNNDMISTEISEDFNLDFDNDGKNNDQSLAEYEDEQSDISDENFEMEELIEDDEVLNQEIKDDSAELLIKESESIEEDSFAGDKEEISSEEIQDNKHEDEIDDFEDISVEEFDFFKAEDTAVQDQTREDESTEEDDQLNVDIEEENNDLEIQESIEVENNLNDNEILKAFAIKKRAELETAKIQATAQKVKDFLPEIEPVGFVNVLSMQEFKNSDNFTFVLGRNETGKIIFESLKQCYNIAFFANINSYELLNTMILSFMLKNNSSDFKLALNDGSNSHNFTYYTGSSYLYNNKIAENEDEITNTLIEISKELESRYHTLAKFNVRSIDEYNILAKSTQTPKLSQILIVIDGYFELMHSSNFEKIKSCLYQILRLGRIAGIYCVIVTNHKIEEDIINFNLPARIGFKCSENDDSIAMIGELGLDKLSNKHEYLYSSINHETAQHLRQPSISDSIIKILIDNIEK